MRSQASSLYPNLSPEEETTKPERKWSELSRNEKLASVLYPNHVSQSRRKEMADILRGEGKRTPFSNAKLGGQAKRGK